MKKFTLLLAVTLSAAALTTSAQASVFTVRYNPYRFFSGWRTTQIQKTNTDSNTVKRNILWRYGIDLDKYIKQSSTPKPTSTPTQRPTAKPTSAPTQKPTAKPTSAPTQKPTVKPTSAPTQKPTAKPTAAPTVNSQTDLENQVLRLVNEERSKRGLGTLKRAADLDALARAHSQDMIKRHFFDHTNPDGQSPFDRMRAAGISYRAAAENIAYGQSSATSVMDAWMNSAGHRKNILNASYTEIGIGAVKNSGGTIYWTQEFVKR